MITAKGGIVAFFGLLAMCCADRFRIQSFKKSRIKFETLLVPKNALHCVPVLQRAKIKNPNVREFPHGEFLESVIKTYCTLVGPGARFLGDFQRLQQTIPA